MHCSSWQIQDTACIPSTGSSPSGTGIDYSTVSPARSQFLPGACCSMDSCLHSSTGTVRTLLQHELLLGSQPPLGIHLLRAGVSYGLPMDLCSTTAFHGLQWDSLSHHGLQGKLSTWNTSSPASSLTLLSAELFFPRILTLLFSVCFDFCLFLNLLSQRFFHHHCWAQHWPVAGLSWRQLALALCFWQLLKKPPVVLCLPKSCHADPIYGNMEWHK